MESAEGQDSQLTAPGLEDSGVDALIDRVESERPCILHLENGSLGERGVATIADNLNERLSGVKSLYLNSNLAITCSHCCQTIVVMIVVLCNLLEPSRRHTVRLSCFTLVSVSRGSAMT